MEYKKLSAMKKDYFSFKDGRNNFLVDSAAVVDLLRASDMGDVFGGYPSGVLASIVSGKINSFLALHSASWDFGFFDLVGASGRKYFFDFESDKTCIYDAKTGKQLYQYIKVRALRVASFAPGAGWRDSADYNNIFGCWSLGSGSCDSIEISA